MRKLSYIALLISLFFISILLNGQSSNVTFKTRINTTESGTIPNVYVKIYLPGEESAVDSVFTNELGVLEREMPFSYQFGSLIYKQNAALNSITKKLSPNVITTNSLYYTIEYAYTFNAELVFIDIQGREFFNHSELATGIYFYYLQFEDGYKSLKYPITITKQMQLSVKLINKTSQSKSESTKSGLSTLDDAEIFYAEFIKDGYVTKRDTILVDSIVIERNYQLAEADIPTAYFSTAGNFEVGDIVVFNAAASHGANDEELKYSWDFGNGKKGQSEAIPHMFNSSGDFLVTLTVTGEYGASNSISKTISIAPGSTPSSHMGVLKGIIRDEDELGISNATLSLVEGETHANSNDTGFVSISELPVGIPIHFKITKAGYVNQTVEVSIPEDTEEACFFTTLKSRGLTISLENAEYGGSVVGEDGSTVNLPVEALLKEDGTRVTGNVDVSITPVNVATESSAFPGTFEAYRSDGEDGVLLSYGVSEFNFQQGDEELKLAAGKTATILVPIYTSGAMLGDEIPLWSVNEDNGTWIQEGVGTVVASDDSPTGLAFQAEVGHFSWWNCDDFDDDRERNGLCWRWECTTARCYKVKVGCWMSGARRNDGSPASSIKKKRKRISLKSTEAEVPPVFEVREFVAQSGKNLKFPGSVDIYVEGRAFSREGELLIGDFTVRADDDTDTFKIELKAVSELYQHDTIELPLNTIVEGYADPEAYVHYKADIAESKLYRLNVQRGDVPSLKGIYVVHNNDEYVTSGDIGYSMPCFAYADTGSVIVSLVGENATDSGNFSLSLNEITATPIALNDSIFNTLNSSDEEHFYSLKIDTNTVFNCRQYIHSDGGYGNIEFVSPHGAEIDKQAMNSAERTFTASLLADSTYYLMVNKSGDEATDYVIVTEEDEQYSINYGDTIIKSLESYQDIDMFNFEGLEGDLISLQGFLPNYDLYGGQLKLIDEAGNQIAVRDVNNYTSTDHEVIYNLPADGTYSIVVYGTENDTGSYKLILNKLTHEVLEFNAMNVVDVLPQEESYYEFTVPDNANVCLAAVTDVSSGEWDLWSADCQKINDSKQWHFMDYYIYPYVVNLTGGKYYLKITNEAAAQVYLNIIEAVNLSFNDKGYTELIDSIGQLNKVNAYAFTGSAGDGVHAILERQEGPSIPSELDIRWYSISSDGDEMYLSKKQIKYYQYDTPDTTILAESAGSLSDDYNSETWVMVVYAKSIGNYKLKFHEVAQSDNLIVDNDFAEYPDAETASQIAAGFAIAEGGTLLIANGEYSSYLPLKIEADDVEISGQEKETVMLVNLYNRYSNPAFYYNGSGGIIHNLSFSTLEYCYPTMEIYGDELLIENLNIKPFGTNTKVNGTMKVRADNVQIRDILHTDARDGINYGGITGHIENCTINTTGTAIVCGGHNITVKNNTLSVSESLRAMEINCGRAHGDNIIDSNNVTMTYVYSTSDNGIINVSSNELTADSNTTFIRHNRIQSAGDCRAFMLYNGNPPAQMILENNTFNSTYPSGSKALLIGAARTDGGSSIIARNNTFNGLSSRDVIYFSGIDVIAEGQQYGLYNNSFRMVAGAEANTEHNFINTYIFYSSYEDTASIYLVNNIFEGNGSSYLVKCVTDFSLYSDYNNVYNFSNYIGDLGTLIGTTNDQTTDPLFLDDDLHIGPASPAINNGASPALFEYIPTLDINGVSRPQGGGFDIGAFEVE